MIQPSAAKPNFNFPPGCYVARGVQVLWFPPTALLFALPDHVIVVVGCDQMACVDRQTRTQATSRLGRVGRAVHGRNAGASGDKVDRFITVSEALLEDKPKTNRDAVLEQALERLKEILPRNLEGSQ